MIRDATLDDMDSLLLLYKALVDYHRPFGPAHEYLPEHYKTKKDFYKMIIEGSKGKMKMGFILVAEDEGKIIGMIVAQYVTVLDGHKYPQQVYIQDMVVDPNSRRHKLASRLGHEAAMRAKKDGIQIAVGWVSPHNKHVKEAMEGMGFKPIFSREAMLLEDYNEDYLKDQIDK